MVNVLIPTKPDDTHAFYVKLALEKKGHQATLWYTADFPSQLAYTFDFRHAEQISWQAQGKNFKVEKNEVFDVVWLRRPRKPVLPSWVHDEDKENAKNENNMFFQSYWQVLCPDAFWINPIHSARVANSKLWQLKLAKKIEFKIPPTVMSNDPSEIKKFMFEQEETVYKTFYPLCWIKEKEMRLAYTREIHPEDLPTNAVLQATPGIFQAKIPKAYELRVTYFGREAVAVKIYSQEHARGKVDWRYVPTQELRVEPIQLPRAIDEKCQQLMQELQLVFACIDLIVTPDGEYYFLEVNEQGQFLWIEDICPQVKMLDRFIHFLIHREKASPWEKTKDSVCLPEFNSEVEKLRSEAIQLHVNPGIC